MAASRSSFLVRKTEASIVMAQNSTYTSIGTGGAISAINGLKIVEIRAKILQIPKIREHTIAGKYSALIR